MRVKCKRVQELEILILLQLDRPKSEWDISTLCFFLKRYPLVDTFLLHRVESYISMDTAWGHCQVQWKFGCLLIDLSPR